MSTSYFYKLNDGDLTIILVDELGPLNTWTSTPESNCLVVEGGIVSVVGTDSICKTASLPYDPVVTLKGANWSSKLGDTGIVQAHLVSGCTPTSWELFRIE